MTQVCITVFWSFSRLKVLKRTSCSGLFSVTIFIVVFIITQQLWFLNSRNCKVIVVLLPLFLYPV